jgi:hypothetical protein
MFANVPQIVAQFKRNWSRQFEEEAILQACADAEYQWRDRKLGPVETVRLFLLQVLFGNVACNYVPHLAGKKLTGSAYCAARNRLPLSVLQQLLTTGTAQMATAARNAGLWLGHRLFMLDGSSFSMADNDELRKHFGQPSQQATGCGFPVAHWLALMHFGSGLFQKVVLGPLNTHDMTGVSQLHPELQRGDVLLGDRAFGAYAHLAALVSRGIHGIFRAQQKVIIDFTPGRAYVVLGKVRAGDKGKPRSRWIKSLGELDQIVEWFRPRNPATWLSEEAWANLPQTLLIRELRYTIARPGFRVRTVTLVTTLLDAQRYSKEELAQAYGLRWTIETAFNHIKTTMKMNVLRSQTVVGIQKELTMFLLVYNLVRMTILEAARRQGVPADRISFVDALRWLATAPAGSELRDLVVNPLRLGRVEPRVLKRRRKAFPLMVKPRGVLRQALMLQWFKGLF